jgi:hypothetical protein
MNMKSRLERVQEQLAKEQKATDIRRLKRAYIALNNVSADLAVPFYVPEHDEIAKNLNVAVGASMAQIQAILVGATPVMVGNEKK